MFVVNKKRIVIFGEGPISKVAVCPVGDVSIAKNSTPDTRSNRLNNCARSSLRLDLASSLVEADHVSSWCWSLHALHAGGCGVPPACKNKIQQTKLKGGQEILTQKRPAL